MITPELYPNINFEQQQRLMGGAAEMWRENNVALDTMSGSVRYKIPPRQTNTIINFVVAHLNARCNVPDWKAPFLTDKQLITFIQNLSKNVDLWIIPPIVQQGFEVAYVFLTIFGGRLYYPDQILLENTPFSLVPLIIEIVGESCMDRIKQLFTTGNCRISSLRMPTTKQYLTCFPGVNNGRV